MVRCKWLFKIKEGIKGVQKPRYKARLVAREFTQRAGIDYNEVFSPVVRHTSIRVILALTTCKDYELEQLDVKTAFLHGNLEEVIYMRQPPGYEQGNKVCLLKKSFYGLKQSPRQWYRRFDEYMLSNGFKRSSYDSCVYYRSYAPGEYIYLFLYVDDILIAFKSKAEIGSTKSLLKKEFDMKELGEAKKILGMEIVKDRIRKILRVSQSGYVSKILNNFRTDNGKSVQMPLGGHFKLSLKDCPVRDCDVERMSKVPYENTVGSLIYLMVCTRPDIAYTVSIVSRYLANPGKNHWEAMKWILKYFWGTENVGLVYGTDRNNHIDVTDFVDSDYTKDPDKDVEYMALTEAVKEAIWLRGLLEELGVKLNTVAFLEAKTVKVLKVGTKHNVVDALAKVVPRRKLQHCLELLSVGISQKLDYIYTKLMTLKLDNQAKKVMRLMGSGYKKIHVCINNCLLYRKNDKGLTVCRTCRTSRWKVDNKIKKVYENIPTKRITDGVLRHPADLQAWRTIDEKFPKITENTRNLRLGISADGVDINTGNRHHSVWPVLTVIYNLPSWLCMKRKFINLSGLIRMMLPQKITLIYMPFLLWTINDYPALGTLCGFLYNGFKGCVVCGKDTNCVRLSASSKQSYVGHRRYLPYNHPFRKQKKAFNGQQEFLQAPIPMTGEQIYNEVKHIENKWGKGKRTNNNASENQEDTRGRGGKIQKQKRNTTEEEGSSSQVNGQNGVYWKKFNIWYRKLKYWRHNPVPHCIDFMHVEKNVAESIVGTLLHVPGKTKDGLNARLDLAELGVKPELFAMQDEDKTTLPPAGYTLTNAEKDIFCETLHNIKVPEGYCSNFSSLVNLKDRKLIGLKSHDYHMLMQEFLPIAIRSIMHPPTRYAIIRFCFFFKSICSKEIILQELDKMQAELVVTLCLLEKFFPPSFFDIMIHLTVHLTREVKLCGPICFRWMYPFERCMKVIKGHVRNRNKPEGCIAEETIAEETIEFFSEYHKSMETIGIPPDKSKAPKKGDASGKDKPLTILMIQLQGKECAKPGYPELSLPE
ncbi:retrovirus-related pol polyprotein from transposon TNT 1-94 [Tanacetum coccineum]|uniref:Retrovirus-related pol polyprotein from transposon TNT 1-94 n=1 Tax=Tanacetum coccineum TaxID=301880 RepID=A0ABQ5EJR7_9ASTR